MRRRRRTPLLAGAGVIVAGLAALAVGDGRSVASEPAPPDVLEQIAAKNDDAAMAAAARMKARSERMTEAAEARQSETEAALDAQPAG